MHVHTEVLAMDVHVGIIPRSEGTWYLWQYSDNAGIATCNKLLVDATCVSWVLTYVSEEVKGISQVWDYLKLLSPCPISLRRRRTKYGEEKRKWNAHCHPYT